MRPGSRFPARMTRTPRLVAATVFSFVALSALAIACGSNPAPVPPTSEPSGAATTPVTTAEPAPTAPAATAEPAPTEPAKPDTATAAATDGGAGGKTCTSSADCAKGEICAGEMGCDKTWTCKPSPPCTKDLRTYCGCDGKTFHGSGSCPGQKYSKKDAC